MKIILQDEGKMAFDPKTMTDEEIRERGVAEEFALDDTPFEVPGWISVQVGGVEVSEIHINDLYPAVIAFKQRYDREMKA